MTKTPKRDLTEHEDEAVPFDEVMKKLLGAPAPKTAPEEPKPKKPKAD